ncbi:hypothetical protein AQ490_18640 [Wenjunlia vitaminophila]|uniref:Uncharacterized protein n=1 Tax=Wenjunlia vitaminophila TaxID=76728 RepID=A0A0T6LVI6_WENVI|nr:polysialyltransferase family glycosyltransferase [Wenjunlia vitaminophila]KRV49724.1 hypothetical protein AQ490_18640 [Wenjunlia vitaminophila]
MRPTPTQVFQASTLYGAATLAAALDAGLFGGPAAARRVLLVCNNAAVPETTPPLSAMRGFERIATRFDQVLDWNDTIRPHHPRGWTPQPNDAPVWERMLRSLWGLGDTPVSLVVESVQVSPAKALTTIFAESDVQVYADGLMSYGPTRDRLPQTLGRRLHRFLHLDLVPGLRPLLLSELDVEPVAVPDDAFLRVLSELGEAARSDPALERACADRPTAVLLGQYLAALDILTADEEDELHLRMLRGAVAAGHRSIVFKAHPTAPWGHSRALAEAAAEAGVTLRVLDGPVLAEAVFERCRPQLVVGCFSTALLTAATYYGIPVARTGTELLLERLTPYQNSNRVPVTIVDFLAPELSGPPATTGPRAALGGGRRPAPAEVAALSELVRTVGYCMQSEHHPALRDGAAAWLRANLDDHTRRYFKRRRLTALALPGGGIPPGPRSLRGNPVARRVARTLRARERARR